MSSSTEKPNSPATVAAPSAAGPGADVGPTVAAIRQAMQNMPMAHYEGASSGRRLAGWKAPGTGPVQAVAPALPMLRNRARDAARNAPLAAAIVRAWVSALVGSGIVCRTQSDDAELRAKVEAAWRNWLPEVDASGAAADFYGLQALAVRAFITDGECFLRFRQRRLSDGLAAPVQIELLESDMLPQLDQKLPNGNEIVQGVEFDRLGRRIAYHFHREHPGDKSAFSSDLGTYSRVPAEFVSHVFAPERPGQLRGVSVLAPILTRLRVLDDFADATSERARLANLFAMFIKRPMPTGADAGIDPLTGKTIQYDDDGAPMAALEPGLSQELLPGEEVTFSDPPQPGAEFAEFVRSQIAQIAAGAGGVPTEFLTGDLRDVTDRALRVSLNEWRRVAEAVQWQVIIPRICIPARAAWAQAAMLAGRLTAAEAMAANVCEWTPPRHRHLHPVQDVQGLRLEVEAGFRSRASVIAEMGYDVADVDAERQADAEREAELGLQSTVNARAGSVRAAGGEPPNAAAPNAGTPGEHQWSGTRLRIRQPNGAWGPWKELRGQKGDAPLVAEVRGKDGTAPVHQWSGTKLRFKNPDGSWGAWADLGGKRGERGPKGEAGSDGRTFIGSGSRRFDPAALPELEGSTQPTDFLVVERDGVTYRVPLSTLMGG